MRVVKTCKHFKLYLTISELLKLGQISPMRVAGALEYLNIISEYLKLGQTISQISPMRVAGALEQQYCRLGITIWVAKHLKFGQIISEPGQTISEHLKLGQISPMRVAGALEQQFGPRGIMTEQGAGAKFCLTKQEITINRRIVRPKQELFYHLNSA